MAKKVYLSKNPSLSVSVKFKDGEEDVIESVHFTNGRFESEKAHEQESIEASDSFARGAIRLETPTEARAALVFAADALKSAAEKADKAASEAEAARAELDAKPKRLRAAAVEAAKAAAAAVVAVADFDKANAPKAAA